MMNEKIMHYANFNITFGKDNEPMLEHFSDVIFPAFRSEEYRLLNAKDRTSFYVSDVEIKEFEEGYALVGNFIKDTQYDVFTTVQNGQLMDTPRQVPTAPYSRFIIFLKNHKMILIRNEGKSPDIRSFQNTIRKMLNYYVRRHNLRPENKERKLPYPLVNIVDIPLSRDIKRVFDTVKQIKKLRLKYFPLNNDINPALISQGIDEQMKKTKSKNALLEFTSPEATEDVKELLDQSKGLAEVRMEVIDTQGNKTVIKEDTFVSQKRVPLAHNIEAQNDLYFIEQAKSDPIISVTSEENLGLYERFKNVLRSLAQR